MKLTKKLLHLCFALKCAWFSLTLGFTLITFLVLFLLNNNSTSQILAFFVGIIASIIATIVLRVCDKYVDSCLACSKISFCIEEMILFIDENIINVSSYDINECKFNLWRYYMLMCEESLHLTYESDFNLISVSVNNIISLVSTNSDIKEITAKKNELIKHKNNFSR